LTNNPPSRYPIVCEPASVARGFERLFGGYLTVVNTNSDRAPGETAAKDPSDWATGDEPITGPQRSYLHTLAQEAGAEVPDTLTKAAASRLIEELQEQTGRGS
jgi:hypothetical protein